MNEIINRFHAKLCKELKYTLINDELNCIEKTASIEIQNNFTYKLYDVIVAKNSNIDIEGEDGLIHQLNTKLDKWGCYFIIIDDNSTKELLINYLTNIEFIIPFRYFSENQEFFLIFKGFRKKLTAPDNTNESLEKFLLCRKIKPNELVLAFLGKNNHNCEELLINQTSKSYKVEVWERDKIWDGLYNSYSQIMNESIISTKGEFVFWIHPRVSVNFELIDNLLLLLCSGYAFASELNFGLYGCTKQLFRKLGLLDEMFLGGECEDLDWFFRMQYHNISFFERGNDNICPPKKGSWGMYRGLSHTQFEEKWIRINRHSDVNSYNVNNTRWTLSKFYQKNKNLLDGLNRNDIEKTWLDSSYSYGVTWLALTCQDLIFEENNFIEEIKVVNVAFIIEIIDGKIRFEFLCPENMFCMITVHNSIGQVILGLRLRNNVWHQNKINDLAEDDFIEIRINCGQYRVFQGYINKFPYKQEIRTGLKLKTIRNEL